MSKAHRSKLSLSHKGQQAWNKGVDGYNSGEKHWNWKGGITEHNRRLRSSRRWKVWRNTVFERDNYTCLKCKRRGIRLEPHHIKRVCDFPELIFDVNNGMTLCYDCHNVTRGRRIN